MAFDSWRPAASTTVEESDWRRYCPYSAQSPALVLPSAADGAQTTLLPLFGSASASPSGSGLAPPAQTDANGSAGSSAANWNGSGSGGLSKAEAMDVVMHAGGPVWAMDWCPAGTAASTQLAGGSRAGPAAECPPSYLALGCHPLEAQRNVIGKPVQGPACIQIWEVEHPEQQGAQQQQGEEQQQQQQQGEQQQQQQQQGEQQQQGQGQQGLQLPRMALALAHSGGVAWQCKWCPDPGLADDPLAALGGDTIPRLGLLAAVLGDGSMRVWAVPHPQAAARARQQQDQHAAAGGSSSVTPPPPLVLSLPAVAAVSSAALGGSMPSVLDWLPAAPHDLIAVGCWDGSVALLRLLPDQHSPPPQQRQQHHVCTPVTGAGGDAQGEGSSMRGVELLSHFSADVLPLRALRWAPPGPCGTAIDSLARQLIMTGGHEGTLRVWDLRDPYQPIYSHVLSGTATILAAEWTTRPFGMLLGLEDASLRGLVLDSGVVDRATNEDRKAMFSIAWRGSNMGAMWGLAVQPSMQVVAYAGEDGVVGVFPVEYEGNSKRRIQHTPVAGLRMEGAALAVKNPAQLARGHGLFAGRVVERKDALKSARLPEEEEALHRVAWSAHAGGAAWLASGGAVGLVRCQWIQSQ